MKGFMRKLINLGREKWSFLRFKPAGINKINLCCGVQQIPGFFGIDFVGRPGLRLDLDKNNLPFDDNSIDVVTCVSAINYFTRPRGQEIINEVFRVLKPGGIARFSTQDLEVIAQRYVNKDESFFFQKLSDGCERFEGITLGDKFVSWFYGYEINGTPCRYFYDYDSLAYLFRSAGFSIIEKKEYMDSRLKEIALIDNRKDQMFYLEAVK